MHKARKPKTDKVGQTYGNATILRHAEEKSIKRVYWEAECSCGKRFFISNSNLVHSNNKNKYISCGCKQGLNSWKNTREDITNKRFNFLTVIEVLPNENSESMVMCKCDCGNIGKYRANAVKRGNTKSCGCWKREQSSRSGSRNAAKNSKSGKRWFYKNIYFRSFVELLYAYHLHLSGIDFLYEPEVFTLKKSLRYKPDFYLINDNRYVEVKGSDATFTDTAKEKVKEFSKIKNVTVLFAKEIAKLHNKTYSQLYYAYKFKNWKPEE